MKPTIYKFPAILLLIVSVSGLLSFVLPPAPTKIDDSVIRFFDTLKIVPQAKLYLHLDKPYYAATDSIWFKGYLVSAITHTPTLPDNFIYVELLDQKDSIVSRQKIKKTDDVFKGNIPLPAEIPAGTYLLRAYTNWMRNAGDEYFYMRSLSIGNSIDTDIQSAITYLPDGNNMQGKIRFYSDNKRSFDKTNIAYSLYSNKQEIGTGILSCNPEGEILIPIKTKKLLPGAYIQINSLLSDYEYEKTFYLPDFSEQFDVSFFPEGGDLLAGVNQTVAFKCQQANGYSKEIKGDIINRQGEVVCTFQSEHDGMGTFSINPSPGEELVARINDSEKTFKLPIAKDYGIVISTIQKDNGLLCTLKTSPGYVWSDSLYLLAHTRGTPVLLSVLSEQNAQSTINMNVFGEGISHLLLINKEGLPISQRLIFKYPQTNDHWKINCDKDTYAKQEKVRMEISLSTPQSDASESNFSVSITDNQTIIPDKHAANILSDLLLTSDLKGYIHNPGYYFGNKDDEHERRLDLLMLTHGWTRFATDNLSHPIQKEPEFYAERGQFISGKINNFMGKKAKKANVFVMSPQHNIIQAIDADENGNFVVDNIDYTGSTTFVIQAQTSKGAPFTIIEVDRESIPEKGTNMPFMDLPELNKNYLSKTAERYYSLDGERIVRLKGVEIKGKDLSSSALADRIIAGNQLNTARNAFDLLYGRRQPVHIPSEASIKKMQENFTSMTVNHSLEGFELIEVDGIRFWDNPEILRTIYTEDILSIEMYDDQTRYLGGSHAIRDKRYGATIIKLKPEARDRQTKPNIAWLQTLGYTEPTEFYNPTYDTPEKGKNIPDLRSTIYWNPSLQFDKDGKAVVEFYTSDSPSSYNVEIEGISKSGEIHRYLGNMSDI